LNNRRIIEPKKSNVGGVKTRHRNRQEYRWDQEDVRYRASGARKTGLAAPEDGVVNKRRRYSIKTLSEKKAMIRAGEITPETEKPHNKGEKNTQKKFTFPNDRTFTLGK